MQGLQAGDSVILSDMPAWDSHLDGEGVRNVLEEDQPENRVFVNRCIQIRLEPVGGGPEFLIQFLQKASKEEWGMPAQW